MKKLIVNTLLIILAIYLFFMLITPATSGQAECETYIIQPGDTLWEICEEKFPDEDPRKVIYEIKKINGMETSEIRAFQKIEVPKGI